MSEESGNSQPINLGFWKLGHSHDSPRQLALKITLMERSASVALGEDRRELEAFPGSPGKVT